MTSEPSGTAPPRSDGHRFVVQRHRARRLHYDLRLEVAGVLASWAVPKGPTLDAAVKRMAVHVEDHPLDYFDFEGVIPAGEYGGGDVVVWDWGTWQVVDTSDPLAAIEAGDLHFDLDGEKLHGRFVLVRRGADQGGREQWLLLKKRDEAAVAGWDPEQHPRSVKSGRTNDEIKDAPSATWSSTVSWAGPTPDELAALDALGPSGRWTLGEHTLALQGLDKVLVRAKRPHGAVTKRDLIRHAAITAPATLPYVHEAVVALHRFPDGVTKRGSWTRGAGARAPDWLARRDGHLVLDSPAALAWAANQSTIELALDPPTRWAVIDLQGPFEDVLVLARLCHTALDHLGLEGRPVLDGAAGVAIWIPVAPSLDPDQVSTWVERLGDVISAPVPDLAATARAAPTPVVPISARPAPGAPVTVPIGWGELDDPELRPDRWTVRDVGERLAVAGDPLAPLIGRDQRLPPL